VTFGCSISGELLVFTVFMHICDCKLVGSRWQHLCARMATRRLLLVGQFFMSIPTPVPDILEPRLEVVAHASGQTEAKLCTYVGRWKPDSAEARAGAWRRHGDTPLPPSTTRSFCCRLGFLGQRRNATFKDVDVLRGPWV
jgi:hypothetical protein